MVAQDDVPWALLQGIVEFRASPNHPRLDLKAVPGEALANEFEIVRRVCDKEDSKAGLRDRQR
jgi:hypothetical protein